MVGDKIQEIVNRNKREFFKITTPHKYNVVKFFVTDSKNHKAHEMKKASVAYDLIAMGHVISTEATLKNGRRPDIVIMDIYPAVVYEIIHTESDESIVDKGMNYLGLKIVKVRTDG